MLAPLLVHSVMSKIFKNRAKSGNFPLQILDRIPMDNLSQNFSKMGVSTPNYALLDKNF